MQTQTLSWPSDEASSWHYQGDTSSYSLAMDPLEVARPALHRSNVLKQGPLHLIISRFATEESLNVL